ncbi:hypothetical protein G4B88_022522 [Cannabis sativa]|uniref:phosphoglycolate phosphatase n=1 Tax=Cannabis sativa TaxID=3483 RepID=A0A7J6HX69_CANSA|nr:hypothetical protein G4B88_022522 [Cannabis sativa]
MESSSTSTHQLSAHNIGDLIDSVDAFLFDCDGVIWKGDFLIYGGKKLVFVTNNSTKSRSQYAKKFQSLGISVSQDEIFSSSFAAAMFLKVHKFPQDKKVYVIGGEGILEELQLAGFTGFGGPEDDEKLAELKPNSLFEHDKSVGAVVVGLDPRINYYKLQYGTLCIRENPGCVFIATNRDSVGHMTNLQEWPGAGCMVAAICGSTQKEPIVVGKPSTFMMDFLLERYNISCSRMCMVGDRLDTDILFGRNAGCKTLLVLSGVTTLPTLEDPSNTIQPDYYTSKVSDIFDLMASLASIRLEHVVLHNETEPTQKSKLKWSKEATTLLISAWLNTSKDNIVGNDQISRRFWDRIAKYFNTNCKGEERRSGKQCKDHWNKMNQKVVRFNSCYKQVQQAHHSDWSGEQIIENAHDMYKSENNNSNFLLMHCWRLLKDESKWNTVYQPQGGKRTKVSESGEYTSSSNADISDHEVSEVRQKAAKRKEMENHEQHATFYDISERKAEALEKLLAIEKEKTMTKYMDYLLMDTSHMTPEQKKDHEKLCIHIKTNILKY